MADSTGFFDFETEGPIQISLQQSGVGFRLLRQFGYRARDPAYREPFIVPADTNTFITDLASIPWFFAWLVPGFGTHIPAVLLHDGLVRGEREPRSHLGPDVDRKTADRLLRDAMADLGTPKIRRWLMWAAVTLATAWVAMKPRLKWRALVLMTVGTIVILGSIATLDLFDIWNVLPWMGDRVWWAELIAGAVFALVIPLAISLLWGPLWAAAAIAGVTLAFLFHVTVVIFLLYGAYWLAESAISRPEGNKANARKSYIQAVNPKS